MAVFQNLFLKTSLICLLQIQICMCMPFYIKMTLKVVSPTRKWNSMNVCNSIKNNRRAFNQILVDVPNDIAFDSFNSIYSLKTSDG